MKKRLSVIIPVFNSKSVDKAINSIKKTDEIELLVIDGGSESETIDLLDKNRDKIDYYISERDKGLYDAMNKGIANSTGEWVFTLASDDQLLCNPLAIIDKYENRNYDLICGNLLAKNFENRYFLICPNEKLSRLDIECSICHPGTFFRKCVYEKYGLYDLKYKCAADHELFLRLYKNGISFLIIPELITFFLYGGTSTTHPFRAFKEDLQISDRYSVPYFKSRAHYINRIVNLYGSRWKDRVNMPHRTQFMNYERLMLFLDKHPEVINKQFDIVNKERKEQLYGEA